VGKGKQPSKEYITVYHRTNTPIEEFGKTPIYSKENKINFLLAIKRLVKQKDMEKM
jgi:hypothetical protein